MLWRSPVWCVVCARSVMFACGCARCADAEVGTAEARGVQTPALSCGAPNPPYFAAARDGERAQRSRARRPPRHVLPPSCFDAPASAPESTPARRRAPARMRRIRRRSNANVPRRGAPHAKLNKPRAESRNALTASRDATARRAAAAGARRTGGGLRGAGPGSRGYNGAIPYNNRLALRLVGPTLHLVLASPV